MNKKSVAMNEEITILFAANNTFLVKTFSGPNLEDWSFVAGKEFNVTEERVFIFQSLLKLF